MDFISTLKMRSTRTSQSQFEVMVDFMERNGDLSKHANTPKNIMEHMRKWEELTGILNLDVTGSTGTVEKWKKIWSDFKCKTKKKARRIHHAAVGDGPVTSVVLTKTEKRVLKLMGLKLSMVPSKLKEVELAAADPLEYLEEDKKPEVLDVASSPADSESHHSEAHSDDDDDDDADAINDNGIQSFEEMETAIEEEEVVEEIIELPTTNQERTNITIKPQGHVLKLVRLVPYTPKSNTNLVKNTPSNTSKTEREQPTAHHSHTNITNKTNTNLTNKTDTNLTNKTDTNLTNRTQGNISKINRFSKYDSNRHSKRRHRTMTASEQFLNVDAHWRNIAREFATENSNLRRRELELRERELQQQAEWQRLFGRCLDIVERYVSN